MGEDRVEVKESVLAPPTVMGTVGALWGLGGVLLLLSSAVYRLTPIALEAFDVPFLWYHWVGLAVCLLFMAISEGYRGFQQAFSPRVASRARYLRSHPRIALVVLAPLFCMGYFHATRKRQMTSIALTTGIIMLIVLVRLVPQPWRGIIDVGVVMGLVWGIIALLVFAVQAWDSNTFFYGPEVPDEETDGSVA